MYVMAILCLRAHCGRGPLGRNLIPQHPWAACTENFPDPRCDDDDVAGRRRWKARRIMSASSRATAWWRPCPTGGRRPGCTHHCLAGEITRWDSFKHKPIWHPLSENSLRRPFHSQLEVGHVHTMKRQRQRWSLDFGRNLCLLNAQTGTKYAYYVLEVFATSQKVDLLSHVELSRFMNETDYAL